MLKIHMKVKVLEEVSIEGAKMSLAHKYYREYEEMQMTVLSGIVL